MYIQGEGGSKKRQKKEIILKVFRADSVQTNVMYHIWPQLRQSTLFPTNLRQFFFEFRLRPGAAGRGRGLVKFSSGFRYQGTIKVKIGYISKLLES